MRQRWREIVDSAACRIVGTVVAYDRMPPPILGGVIAE
jgi:hypothetical protein